MWLNPKVYILLICIILQMFSKLEKKLNNVYLKQLDSYMRKSTHAD